MKDVQAIGEPSSPRKRVSETSKQYISPLFLFLWVVLCLDPDPADQYLYGAMRIRIHNNGVSCIIDQKLKHSDIKLQP
jgi:hypothetical protein